MEIYFRREIQHNYLIIEPDECLGWNYEIKMLVHNSIDGLLKFRMKQLDGEQQFFYEITSKQPLSRILELRAITAEEICLLMTALASILNKIELFLLLPEQILLQPEYIYLEPENFQIYFCLVPGRKADFSKELQELLYFLLKKVNHQNQESVVLAYGLYQETQKENYGMGNLMHFLSTSTIYKKDILETEKEDSISEIIDEKERYEEKKDINIPKNKISNTPKNRMELFNYMKYICFSGWILFVIGMGYIYLNIGMEYLITWKNFIWGFFISWLCISFIIGWRELKYSKKYEFEEKNDIDEKEELKSESQEKWSDFFKEDEKCEDEKDEEKTIEKELQTVLLSKEKVGNERHYLMSLQEEYEDIVLSYYPFSIGKAEYMTDYVIPRPSISRMHVRIERTEQGFQITDLNSTNGTWVGDHQLEANETFSLNINDKVRLADLYFWFK